MPALREAYRHCARVARARAKNFYPAFLWLRPCERRALCALYAFCRAADDAADDTNDPAEARARLLALRKDVDEPSTLVGIAMADARRRFCIPREALLDVLDGVEMDLEPCRYETFEDLRVYCERVASAVGIAALGILGARAPEARPAARDLGIAMQLTNILRDIAQDAARGRVYIPLEDLRAHGIGPQDVLRRGVLPGPLVRFEAARARDFFRRGLRLLAHLPRRTRPVPAALAGVYRAVLDRIASAAEHPNGVELPAASRWRAAATSGLRALLGVP